MLRPEALVLKTYDEEDDSGIGATVLAREFFGHDQLIKLRLDSGPVLCSRLGVGPGFRPGERVRVEARGTAVVFPRD